MIGSVEASGRVPRSEVGDEGLVGDGAQRQREIGKG